MNPLPTWLPEPVRRVLTPPVWTWLSRGLLAGLRSVLLAIGTLTTNITLFVLFVVSTVLTVAGVGIFLVPLVALGVRAVADLDRRLLAQWTGVEIPVPYRPRPAKAGIWRLYRWVVTDPATWRDLAWLVLSIQLVGLLLIAPAALIAYGIEGILGVPVLLYFVIDWYGYGVFWPMDNLAEALLSWPQAAVLLPAGLTLTPHTLRWFALVSQWLLAPTRAAALAVRVDRLTQTRTETVDAQATELRRIERDLHDGAQARLVAVSMKIGLAEELLARDPEAALRLMAQAREHSGMALAELRDLVRGIHPPVLAERGLDGAVQALALTVPLPVDVDISLPGRPLAPVESAAYFAIAEAVTNAVKHARASRISIRLGYDQGRLLMVVRDDGRGGAVSDGSGLRGIERRLAAFDGTMSVASPPGGPTTVTMELPCELSSPRTSPSSGTA
ncbi:sensor histidine kinase [Dactylosporangium siamense]|uniref:histidine kinase n=1 Tax=Dactylosporangium siamense TaxID=685454 RepID=A0A919PFS3_9ACTN|nr:sensor histidine kinase [Dactylosporangium siamense]GIG44026.1 histidine kinase [Dactylosporangium siamense]